MENLTVKQLRQVAKQKGLSIPRTVKSKQEIRDYLDCFLPQEVSKTGLSFSGEY